MRGWGVFLLAANLAAPQTAPAGVIRGMLLARDQDPPGQLRVEGPDRRVYSFDYDAKTLVQKDGKQVRMADLQPGDALEIVSRGGAAPGVRYAQVVRTLAAVPERKPAVARRRAPSAPPDDLFPRGDLSLAGTVASVTPELLVLRTRGGGSRSVLLRADTRFLEDGAPVERAGLPVNAHVFVRAGRTSAGEVEAFQVVWGAILKPDGTPSLRAGNGVLVY